MRKISMEYSETGLVLTKMVSFSPAGMLACEQYASIASRRCQGSSSPSPFDGSSFVRSQSVVPFFLFSSTIALPRSCANRFGAAAAKATAALVRRINSRRGRDDFIGFAGFKVFDYRFRRGAFSIRARL